MKDRYKYLKYTILAALVLLWIFPVIWTILMSFRHEVESVKWPLAIWPKKFLLDNYLYILKDRQSNLGEWIKNSVVNAVLHTALVLFVCSLAAYPLARFRFRFRSVIYYFLLSTMMVPGIINLVPLYATVSSLKLAAGRWALILPGVPSVFGLFMLRQFFMSIPKEMEEAATIDGAGHFKYLIRILLPLTKPSFVVLGLNSFLGNWNDYLWPQIVVSNKSQQTLTLGLSIIKGQYGSHLPRLMAITVVSLILPIAFFMLFNKQLIKGIDMSSGIK